MPQLFPGRDDDTAQTQRNTGARNGFVGAFVRSVRRGQQTSPIGKVAIGVLVVVLTAGSVIGLSVLLRGTGKPATTNSAAVLTGNGASRSPASSTAVRKTGQGGKPGAPGVPAAPRSSRCAWWSRHSRGTRDGRGGRFAD